MNSVSPPVSGTGDMGAQGASLRHPMRLPTCWGQRTKHHGIRRPRLGPSDVLRPIRILSCWLSPWADWATASFPANRALVLLVEGRAASGVESGWEQGHGRVIPQRPQEGGGVGTREGATPSLASTMERPLLLTLQLPLLMTAPCVGTCCTGGDELMASRT